MAPPPYKTLSETSLPAAEDAEAYFGNLGYAIKRESSEMGFPFTPAFVATRKPTRVVVEVLSEIHNDRIEEWKCYCNACQTDTRMMFISTRKVGVDTMALLAKYKMGLIHYIDGIRSQVFESMDIAFQIMLPDLTGLPKSLRAELGPAYEHFERKAWREGFEDACIALENRVRPYLWSAIDTGRLAIYNKNGAPKTVTKKQIFRMTLGQLGATFRSAAPVNHLDSTLGDIILNINSERIKVAHKKYKAERTLRQKVPMHTLSIINAMKKIP